MPKNRQEEDLLLISNIVNGDRKSEKKLYDKYWNITYSYITRNYPHSDVEDSISEILIKVFSKISTYSKEKSKFNSWVLSITKNYLIDKFRCQYEFNVCVNNSEDISNMSFQCNDNSYSYTINMDHIDNVNTINQISNTLTHCDYAFLDMHYGQGYSYNEIADKYNTTSNTVSNRVSYIKSKLKNTISYEFN